MAKIEFNPNQPIQALSGTVGKFTFRTVNGRTFLHTRPEPVLPKNPTPAQREKYKRQVVINQCLDILQDQIPDLPTAIKMRGKIFDRLTYLYKKFAPTIKARTKLQKKIMTEYYAKFSDTSSVHSRGNVGPMSVHSR